MNFANATYAVFKREFQGYFATPLAYVFIVIFLLAMGSFTFYFGRFYETGRAELNVFFGFHPWLYLFLIPAISMRLWAEEQKSGTIELLLTLPISVGAAVLGKFLAAWAFAGIALLLTFPMWLTVNWLGLPDNGVIVASYFGSWLMAGGYLAIGSCLSALTNNQVIAFVLTVVVSFMFTISGNDLVLDFFQGWAPLAIVNAVSSFSFLTHFAAIMEGVIDLRDVVFFGTLMALFLFINVIVIDLKRAG
jgi:gliding motility-associated transport system permease protein